MKPTLLEKRFAMQVARRLFNRPGGAYDTPVALCPYCRQLCDAEWVDIGVGMQQCSPYHCDACGALQIGPHDKPGRELTAAEHETGWYAPHWYVDGKKFLDTVTQTFEISR